MTGRGVSGETVVVTGTGTDVGKTIATAALAVRLGADGLDVALCKPLQTGMTEGEPGDVDRAAQLSGVDRTAELYRLPDPLAPETAARLAGRPQVTVDELVDGVRRFAGTHGMTLVEGAGGVLVRLGTQVTVLDLAAGLAAPVVVVTRAGLGTLSDTELTVRAVEAAGLRCAGLVIGSMPAEPDLATRCNLEDLPRLTGVPIIGRVPAGAGAMQPPDFRRHAPQWFTPGVSSRLSTT